MDVDDVQDLTISELEELIADTPEGSERDALKAEIRRAELETGEPRQGVIELTNATSVAPPAGPATSPVADEQDAEDLSGRPPLAEVARDRTENTIERVLEARKEN